MPSRYAVYYCPPAASDLALFAQQWFAEPAAQALTQQAQQYGFHATLKAPFVLQPGLNLMQLDLALADLAATHSVVAWPHLAVEVIGDFIALVPTTATPTLNQLAADCVQRLDVFRAPLREADYQKRPDAHLTPHQQALRQQWGYPYVLDEYRFHLTLTDAIADMQQRQAVLQHLRQPFATVSQPTGLDQLSLVQQTDRTQPFQLYRTYPLRAN